MSESSGTPIKTSPNGIQGLAMMAPILGLPLGVHALSGALVTVAGIAVTVAPVAVPVAVPVLFNVASKGGFESIVRKFVPSVRITGSAGNVVNTAADDTGKDAAPIIRSAVQADL